MTGSIKVAHVDLLSKTGHFMPQKISGASSCEEKKQMIKAVFSGWIKSIVG